MDSATEKNCLEELTIKLIEDNEKITQKSISNLYLVHYDVARSLLNKLLKLHMGTIKLVKEFWVSGWKTQLEYRIDIVSEDKSNELEKLWSNFSANLYSLASENCLNGKNYNTYDVNEIKMKAITLDVGHRIVEYRSVVEPPVVKQEAKPAKQVKGLFSSVSKVDKKPEIKKNENDKLPSSSKNEEAIDQPKPTPKVSSPAVVKKTPKGKAKGSISSFFNAKQTTSKPVEIVQRTEKTPEREKVSVDIESSEEDVKKSSVKPEQQKKKTKLKARNTKNNKRSRIMQLEGSSDEDKEKDDDEYEEPEAKFIKFDREITPEPDSIEPIEPIEGAIVEKSAEKPAGRIRIKLKRTVTKTYEDEDGFIKTVKEVEQYSTSEDEDTSSKVPTAKENEKPNKYAAKEIKPNVVTKKKQGSITSFFSKK